MWGSLQEDWAVHCLPFGFGSVRPAGVGVTRRRWRRGGRAKHHRPVASSPTNSSRDRLTRSCDPWGPISGIGSRATRRTSEQTSERTDARSAIPPLLACHPPPNPHRRKKSSASSSKLKTGRIVPPPSTPPPAPSVRTSGGPSPAPTSYLTINQEVSNLIVASVPPSIALSIIRSSSLLRCRDTVRRDLASAAGTSRYTVCPRRRTCGGRRQE